MAGVVARRASGSTKNLAALYTKQQLPQPRLQHRGPCVRPLPALSSLQPVPTCHHFPTPRLSVLTRRTSPGRRSSPCISQLPGAPLGRTLGILGPNCFKLSAQPKPASAWPSRPRCLRLPSGSQLVPRGDGFTPQMWNRWGPGGTWLQKKKKSTDTCNDIKTSTCARTSIYERVCVSV